MFNRERCCAVCGLAYTAVRANQRYCSAKCRQRWWQQNEKARAGIWSWRVRHPTRVAELQREWYLRNREYAIATSCAWARSHRAQKRLIEHARRGQIGGRRWSREEMSQIAELLEGPCAYCGVGGPMTLDHRVALSRGGAHDLSNLVAACKPCNSRKRTRDELEFRALLALEAFTDGRRRRLSERRTPYRVRRRCRVPQHDPVPIRDTDVGSCDVRWATA